MKIAPSTDPVANIETLIEYAKELQVAGADFLHCDIMDGDFVEKKGIDSEIVKLLNRKCVIPLDVHLMVRNPLKVIKKYIEAGANIITVHYEAFDNEKDMIKCFRIIREHKLLAGLSIKPATPVKEILKYLGMIDLLLVMSVEPGKSGQKFIENTYNKLDEIKEIKKTYDLDFLVEVDGGIVPDIAHNIGRKGTDIAVSGSYVYVSIDKKKAINKLNSFVDLYKDTYKNAN